jgi:hypothetical protein
VSLELSGRSGSSESEHSALYQCGSWGSWYTIGSYCAWHIMCLGDATMWDRARCRTCYTSTGSFTDCEYTTVRHKCGC